LSTVLAQSCMLIQFVTTIGAVMISSSTSKPGSRCHAQSCRKLRPVRFRCWLRRRGAAMKAAPSTTPHSGRICAYSGGQPGRPAAAAARACARCRALEPPHLKALLERDQADVLGPTA
jgi:hypothetical protein